MKEALLTVARIKYFLIPMFIFFLIGGGLLIFQGYEGSFLFLNCFFRPEGDYFFPFITFLGDLSVIFCLYILFFSKKEDLMYILVMGAALITTGVIVQVLKKMVFPDMMRPLALLGAEKMAERYYQYPGLPVEIMNSFPSGHSVTIVTAMTVWAFTVTKSYLQVFLALTAILVMHSRIYIGVHFLGDVYASAVIGLLVSLRWVIFYERTKDRFSIYSKFRALLNRPIVFPALKGICFGILIFVIYFKIVKVYLS